MGLTDSRDEGGDGDACPTPAEIDVLMAEAAHLLPGLALRPTDVVAAFSGVCPYTFSTDLPNGKRTRDLHDLGPEGMPNLFALTGGSIRTHRLVAAEMTDRVRQVLPPSAPPPVRSIPIIGELPALADEVRHAVLHEQAATLEDVMFRRLDLGWSAIDCRELPDRVASEMARWLGWDHARRTVELERYRALLRVRFALPLSSPDDSVADPWHINCDDGRQA